MAYEDRKRKREAKFRDIMQDAQGNVIYTGDLWRIADSKEAGSGAKQRNVLIAVLFVLALTVIGSGYIDAQNAMGSVYVILPYIGEVSALFGLLWNAAKVIVPSEGVKTPEPDSEPNTKMMNNVEQKRDEVEMKLAEEKKFIICPNCGQRIEIE